MNPGLFEVEYRESRGLGALCAMGRICSAPPRDVLKYQGVPRRAREFKRVEIRKTPFGAGSAKREACFFGRFKNEMPGHGTKVAVLVSELAEMAWFFD